MPSAVLLASFLGSGHCLAMCGGLIVAGARSAANIILYHAGRLFSYVVLGFLFGYFGERVQSIFNGPASVFVAVLMGSAFIWLGIASWHKRSLDLPLPQSMKRWVGNISAEVLARSSHRRANAYAALLGAVSIFLPCGWLYAFALASAATQTPLLGAAAMFFFWLGTLPALTVMPWLVQRSLGPFKKWAPQISALMLMGVGIASILAKFLHLHHHNA